MMVDPFRLSAFINIAAPREHSSKSAGRVDDPSCRFRGVQQTVGEYGTRRSRLVGIIFLRPVPSPILHTLRPYERRMEYLLSGYGSLSAAAWFGSQTMPRQNRRSFNAYLKMTGPFTGQGGA